MFKAGGIWNPGDRQVPGKGEVSEGLAGVRWARPRARKA